MLGWNYFDERARRLGILDTKLVQATAIGLALIIAKIFPQILNVNIGWFVGLTILFAIKPSLTFFGPVKVP